MASRTAAKPRHQNLTATAANGIQAAVNKFDLSEEDATVGIFPPLPSIQQNGTAALSLFRRDDPGSAPTSPSATSATPSFWEYHRLGTVSHTALGPSASPVLESRYTFLSSEPDQCSESSRPYYQSYADSEPHSSPRAPFSYSNGHSLHWTSNGGQFRRTGQTCLPSGLSGLLRPSVLLRSSWVSCSNFYSSVFEFFILFVCLFVCLFSFKIINTVKSN